MRILVFQSGTNATHAGFRCAISEKCQTPEKLYFTADLHLFHTGIIQLCERPFRDINEMNEALIRNWNSMVPNNGIVLVLGDMFWKGESLEKCAKTMDRLHGQKYLVAGNHDLYSREEYLRIGFADAWDYLELSVNKRRVICSHYPLLEWNGFYRGNWHLHGHAHGRGSHFSARVMDAGVDAHQFMPVPWYKVERELAGAWQIDQMLMEERGSLQMHRPYDF